MSSLIRNTGSNSRLGRRSNLLLRTPIVLKLKPDQKKIYQVGEPSSAQGGYLRTGFRYSGTNIEAVQTVGYRLVHHMITGTPSWLDASGPHDPEFVWYQGAYSTSSPNIGTGQTWSEAYAQFAGFHFTIPASARQTTFDRIIVKYQNLGACWAYGPATSQNFHNKNIRNADYGWHQGSPVFPIMMSFLDTETCNYHQMVIVNNYPYETIDLGNVGNTGDFRGSRDIWEIRASQAEDGHIPTLTYPQYQSFQLTGTILERFKRNNGGWFVPIMNAELNSSTNYAPSSGYGGDGKNNYWASAGLRDVTVEMVID